MINTLLVVALVAVVIYFHNRLRTVEQQVKEVLAKAKTVTPTTVAAKPASAPVPSELMAYVRSQVGAGMSMDAIRSTLLTNGWQISDIERAIAALPLSGARVAVKPGGTEGASAGNRFFEWIKEDWLMKLGALLLLIGFGWLASYAFLHNWIGPHGAHCAWSGTRRAPHCAWLVAH
jgi:hypothetical protein